MIGRKIALASCLSIIAAAGCGVETSEDASSVSEGIITAGPDGTPLVRFVQVPRATYDLTVHLKTLLTEGKLRPSDEETFLRSAGNTSTLDSFCNASSMWLHEQTNQNGPILCFARTGTAGSTNIGAFYFSDGQNATVTSSYWAGSSAGIFHSIAGGPGPTFTAFQRVDVATVNFGNFPRLDQY